MLVSYPRSGNSFLRRLLESWSGIVTGTDSNPNRTLSASLLRCGFKGEGVVDDSVWLVKTHFPERLGYVRFMADRGILITRNPFDAIESYFHMGMTNTHDKSLSPKSFESLKHIWDEFIMNEIRVWKQFHCYWLEDSSIISIGKKTVTVKAKQTTLLVVRYEDIIMDRDEVLPDLYNFLKEEGCPPFGIRLSTFLTSAKSKSSAEPGYKPRQRGEVGKSLHQYSISQVKTMVGTAGVTLLSSLGYNVRFYEHDGAENAQLTLVPVNFDMLCSSIKGPDINNRTRHSSENQIVVNSAYNLRSEDDRFGRKITLLRKSMTQNDSKPFETSI